MAKTLGRGAAFALALGIGVAVAAGGAFAHEHMGPMPTAPMAKAAYVRHQNFKQQGAAFKAILDELKKRSPDKALMAANGTKLRGTAAALPTWFPKGSGVESGFMTDAKPVVWTDPAGFAAAAKRLQVETAKLQVATSAGDIAAIRAQAKVVGGACKSCHNRYRVPEKT